MPKPRKKRHPQRETFNPLAAMQPLPTDKVCADMLRNYAALEAMVHGTSATSEEWVDLSDCVNVVEMLIEMGEIDSMHTATRVRPGECDPHQTVMSRYTPKFTKAERIAFGIVPETCPDVEDALDRLGKPAPQELIEAELKSYGIEYSARLRDCIQAIRSKSIAMPMHEARKAFLFKGTYPLRLALVQQIEATMPGPQPEPEIRKWLRLNNPSHPLIN